MEALWNLISDQLERKYHNPRHGNPEDPVECLFYVMLTRKTPIRKAQHVFERILELVPWPDMLLDMDETQLYNLLYSCGLQHMRVKNIGDVAEFLFHQFGRITLDPLREKSNEDCLSFLTSLPGVGTKTALCVMMYALDRKVFPADTHCIRVLKRLGTIPWRLDHRQAQRELSKQVPPDLAFKLHVNLIAHGQQICRPQKQECIQCTINSYCANNRRIPEPP
ncbi:MAG: hypothetical protein KGZ75_05900 [Syntrophomonadaceae bacterium]|nr:hypothetical protein [Syntrophomonadaceae bacterium]